MAGIRIQHLVKIFPGGTLAVDDVSLDVTDGELLVLLGPSGCGKTTTLRSVAGLEQQTSGDIYIGDRLVNSLPPADRDIAFVFQFYALYPHLSAFDNIAFPLKAAGVERDEIKSRVAQVADLLKIRPLLANKPTRLSAGEQQRVALGRAIIRRPQVFLLDEPLTNLDATLRVDMRAELKRLHADIQTTTLYVTHDQTEAMSLGHRVAVMNMGKLEQVGSPLEIYDHPATLFVAGFIGSPPMNFIDVRLADGPSLAADGTGFRVPITPAMASAIKAKAALRLGIRSEDVHIHPNPQPNEPPAEITVAEPMGDEIIYGLSIPGGQVILAKAPPSLELPASTPVSLEFDPSRMHVFDVDSGRALR